MSQLFFMEPFIMLWFISHLPDQVPCAPSLCPVSEQTLHFELGFTFNLHWLWESI